MNILFEDNHIIALNKTCSDLVQGDKTGDESLDKKLKEYIREKYNKPGEAYIGVVHRLDRPVSGVVLFARTSKALTRLNAMFRDGEINKTYWAIVKNLPTEPSKTLTHYLIRKEKMNKSFAHDKPVEGAKQAILDYRLRMSSDTYHLLEITLYTGRHHQIRCQLAAIGCPIKGDLKYGAPRSNPDGGISLHARSAEFIHPVRQEKITIIAEPPIDTLWQYFVEKISAEK